MKNYDYAFFICIIIIFASLSQQDDIRRMDTWEKILLWIVFMVFVLYLHEKAIREKSENLVKTKEEIKEEEEEKSKRKLKRKIAIIKLKKNAKKFFKEL